MTETSPAPETGQVPNQLAILVPTFDPAVDQVDIWASKVELLLATWPAGKVTELATRLILGCKGTAYQKLQLCQKESLNNDPQSIKRIVELVGGSWGTILWRRSLSWWRRRCFVELRNKMRAVTHTCLVWMDRTVSKRCRSERNTIVHSAEGKSNHIR